MIIGDHEMVTADVIPPETTTPMPACLHYVYERCLGWLGRPEDFKPDHPTKVRTDPALALQRRHQREEYYA